MSGDEERERRRRKALRDGRAQFEEIDRHRYFLSERRGEDVGLEFAARDWVVHHAADWRAWWESRGGDGGPDDEGSPTPAPRRPSRGGGDGFDAAEAEPEEPEPEEPAPEEPS